jgi:hypothetical protein
MTREAVVERFLALHPDLKTLHKELMGEFSELSRFWV